MVVWPRNVKKRPLRQCLFLKLVLFYIKLGFYPRKVKNWNVLYTYDIHVYHNINNGDFHARYSASKRY